MVYRCALSRGGGVRYARAATGMRVWNDMTHESRRAVYLAVVRLSVRSRGLGRSPATPDQPRSGHAGATTATPVAYTAVVCPATQAHRTSPPRGGRRRRPRLAARPSRVTVPAHPQRRRRRPGRRRRCSPPPCLRVAPSSAPSSCASAAPPPPPICVALPRRSSQLPSRHHPRQIRCRARHWPRHRLRRRRRRMWRLRRRWRLPR